MKTKSKSPLDFSNVKPKDPVVLLEKSIKDRLRNYIRKIDLIMKEDPLGIFNYIENGYPKDKLAKGARNKSPNNLDRGLSDLAAIRASYQTGIVGDFCNEVLNHKDFNLYELHLAYLRPSGKTSFVGDITTIITDYLDQSYYSAATLGYNNYVRALVVKDETGNYVPRMCTHVDYRNVYDIELLSLYLYVLHVYIYMAIKGNENVNDFYSKYVLIYKKPFLSELKNVRYLFDNTMAICKRANSDLLLTMEAVLCGLETATDTFLDNYKVCIRPKVIHTCYRILITLRNHISNHLVNTGKSYNRPLGNGDFLIIPDVYKIKEIKDRMGIISEKLEEEL